MQTSGKGKLLLELLERDKRDSTDEEDSDLENDESDSSSADPSENEDSACESDHQQELTEEEIVSKLQKLKATRKEGREKKREILEKMSDLRDAMTKAENRQGQIEDKLATMCISGRNDYSKGAIQQDFAAGIKELDQEIAGDDEFNPDEDARDYEGVARG